MEVNRHDVAGAYTPERRQVLPVVKHALKLVAVNRVGARGRSEINVKLAIAAGKHDGIRKRLSDVVSLGAPVSADHHHKENRRFARGAGDL
jgi:hypothetical protein